MRPFLSPPLLCFSLFMVAMAVPVNERLLDRLPHYAVEPLEPGDSMPPPTQYPVLFGWAASHDLMALAGIQAKCSTLRALVDADEAPKSWSDGMIWRYPHDFGNLQISFVTSWNTIFFLFFAGMKRSLTTITWCSLAEWMSVLLHILRRTVS